MSARVCLDVNAIVDHCRDDAVPLEPSITKNLTADGCLHFAREYVLCRNEAFTVARRQPSLTPVVRDVVNRRHTVTKAADAENGVIDP
jgi:hypothetical protein